MFSKPTTPFSSKLTPVPENQQNPHNDLQNNDLQNDDFSETLPNSSDFESSPESEVVEGQLIELIANAASDGSASPFTALALPAPPSGRAGETNNPVLVYLAALAPSGRRTMRGKLESVSELLTGKRDVMSVPWHLLRYEHVAAIRSRLEEKGLAPASVNATLYALRGVAKAAWNLELLSADDYGRIRNVSPVRGSRLPAGRSLSSGELAALLDACERGQHPNALPGQRHKRQSNSVSGVRDAALLGVLYIGGMRRSEVAELKLEDFDSLSGAVKVRGKGNKERLIYLSGAAMEALLDWLELRGDHAGALFQPVRKSGSIYKDGKVTDSAIYKALRKRALQAGVKSFSPHDLRRTFVGDLLERGADIVTVQQLAGHASVSTTARYDRRGEETKKKAAHSLHLPYRSARA